MSKKHSRKSVTVTIPAALSEFLKECSHRIKAGDESAVFPSDDHLQNDVATGGLCADKAHTYFFTFFPEEHVLITWNLLLTEEQIHAVAAGGMKELTLWRCECGRCSSLDWSPDALCFSCNFWEHGEEARLSVETEDRIASIAEWVAEIDKINPHLAKNPYRDITLMGMWENSESMVVRFGVLPYKAGMWEKYRP